MTKKSGLDNSKTDSKKRSMIYAELLNFYGEHLQKRGKSSQTIKNAGSAIRSWLKVFNFKPQQIISHEFGSKFDQFIQQYKACGKHESNNQSTFSSRASIIRSIRNFYQKRMMSVALPELFSERFRLLLRLNNYSLHKFYLLFFKDQISYGRLRAWRAGIRAPRMEGLTIVEKIEQHLQVSSGTLSSTLKTQVIPHRSPSTQPQVQKQYRVWTVKLESEFQKLVEFKTLPVPPDGLERTEEGVWTGRKGETPPSAVITKGLLGSFFGFLCLPANEPDPKWQGVGMSKDELSIALLTDICLLEKFLTVFQYARRNSMYNRGSFMAIAFFMSLLRKGTGYLYQKPELALALGLSGDKLSWQKRCLKTRARLKKIKKYIDHVKQSGSESYGFGRDPQKSIQPVLDSPRPIAIIMETAVKMLADVKKLAHAPMEQARLYRDTLLISLVQANPLRLKMYSIMKFGENLVQKDDGSWWIMFKKNDFKNRRFLKEDYCVPLARPLWEMVETYKNVFRPRFKHSQNCSIVFPFRKKERADAKFFTRQNSQYLSDIVAKRTEQYIKGCNGFRMHSFRHIVVTDIVKINPEKGFSLAASVLNDNKKTVEDYYAHLKMKEAYEPYNEIFTRIWNLTKLPTAIEQSEEPSNTNQRSESQEVVDEK